MNYLDKIKDIIDNYVFTILHNSFYFNDKLIFVQYDFLYKLLSKNFYKINNSNYIFNEKLYSFLDRYNPPNFLYFHDALKSDKKIILEMAMHPNNDVNVYKTHFFDKIFENKELLTKIREHKLFIFIYFGWEAEDFSFKNSENHKSYYEIFQSIIKEYDIPNNSIVILNSNLTGYELEKKYNFNNNFVNVIFESAMELNAFKFNKFFNFNYSIEDYIQNIKKNDKVVLRLNRTNSIYRDAMLHFLYQSGLNKKSVIGHSKIKNTEQLNSFLNNCFKYSEKNPFLKPVEKYFKLKDDIVNKIMEDLPLISSNYDKAHEKQDVIFSNAPIPYDVYEKTIFSWVCTTFPRRDNYVFLNDSTFKPILHYHPILWLTNKETIKYFRESGYKTYSFLFNEDLITKYSSIEEKFILNVYELDRIMNMSRKKLINIIEDNKDTLLHNRNLLFECRSIENILTKFYDIIHPNYI